MKLYQIPEQIRMITSQSEDGEIPPEALAQLEAIEAEFGAKVEYLCLIYQETKAEAEAIESEEKRLSARRKALQNKMDHLKDYLLGSMQAADIPRVEGALVKCRVQKNSQPTITWLGDARELPPELQRVTVSLDSSKAHELLKAEALPDGFEVKQGNHLRIW